MLPLFLYADEQTSSAMQLAIKPARCVALHEGQICYQTLKIEWRAANADTYCLYEQDVSNPLMCWDGVLQGVGRYEFESNKSKKFIMLRKRDAKPMADFLVEVAWVYDASSHRESHWRVF